MGRLRADPVHGRAGALAPRARLRAGAGSRARRAPGRPADADRPVRPRRRPFDALRCRAARAGPAGRGGLGAGLGGDAGPLALCPPGSASPSARGGGHRLLVSGALPRPLRGRGDDERHPPPSLPGGVPRHHHAAAGAGAGAGRARRSGATPAAGAARDRVAPARRRRGLALRASCCFRCWCVPTSTTACDTRSSCCPRWPCSRASAPRRCSGRAPSGWPRRAATGLLLAACALPLPTLVRLHPYQMTYFNAAVGGLAGANGRYETDYWLSSYKEAIEWVNQRAAEQGGRPRPHPGRNRRLRLGLRRPLSRARRRDAGGPADPARGRDPRALRLLRGHHALWRGPGFSASPVVHRIGRDGATFSVIRAR